jgi:hypothetical protein
MLRAGMPSRRFSGALWTVHDGYDDSNAGLAIGSKRVFKKLASKSRDSLYLIDGTILNVHLAVSSAKTGEKSNDQHQPVRSNHKNTRHFRQQ